LNHVQTDAFNRPNRTIGASEITPNRTCQGHAETDAIVTKADGLPDKGAQPSRVVRAGAQGSLGVFL
jgi:hypothetical protein